MRDQADGDDTLNLKWIVGTSSCPLSRLFSASRPPLFNIHLCASSSSVNFFHPAHSVFVPSDSPPPPCMVVVCVCLCVSNFTAGTLPTSPPYTLCQTPSVCSRCSGMTQFGRYNSLHQFTDTMVSLGTRLNQWSTYS